MLNLEKINQRLNIGLSGEHDKLKIKVAEEHKYIVKVIWEKDFSEKREVVINECINFLKK